MLITVTWKCHKKGLCYAHIATKRLNWFDARDYCKTLSKATGIDDEWRTGLAAPADMKYLKEIAKAFGHQNSWGKPIPPTITTDRNGVQHHTRPSGPWIAGSDSKTVSSNGMINIPEPRQITIVTFKKCRFEQCLCTHLQTLYYTQFGLQG